MEDLLDTRGGGRGGGSDDEQMREYLAKIYKNYRTLYEMVQKESEMIRLHPLMQNASRALKEMDIGDAILRRALGKDKSTISQIRAFYDATRQVNDCLNRQWRRNFFKQQTREARRNDPYLDRNTTRGRGADDRYDDRDSRDRRSRDRDGSRDRRDSRGGRGGRRDRDDDR